MGPTAVGKTSLAMSLYDKMDAELISVDSALVYRGMDIGTAKPTKEERLKYPHHLIDICDPAEIYSAAQFSEDATQIIDEIHKKQKTAILVGGTMLYFKALIEGFNELPQADKDVRLKLEKEAEKVGWQTMHETLAKIDPESGARIHPNDNQRIQRALEVYQITGKTLTELQKSQPQKQNAWKLKLVALKPQSRDQLREDIALRFQQMLDSGFEHEVRELMKRGDLNTQLPSIRSVGYRQMWQYLAGEMDYEEMVFRAVTATRQLAKRQMTWLNGWQDLCWLEASDKNNANTVLNLLDN